MKNHKNYIFLMSILVLVAILLLVGHYFVFQDIRRRNQNTSSLSQQTSFRADKHAYLVSTQRTIQNLRGEMELVDNSILAKENEVRFLEDIEGMARANGLDVTIDSISIDESLKSDYVVLLKIKVKTSGGWTGTYKFLSGLESLEKKIKIDSLSLVNTVNPTETTRNSVWQSSFDIKVLKYK